MSLKPLLRGTKVVERSFVVFMIFAREERIWRRGMSSLGRAEEIASAGVTLVTGLLQARPIEGPLNTGEVNFASSRSASSPLQLTRHFALPE